MYTLHGMPNTASTSAHWLLIELAQKHGVEFEFELVDFGIKAQREPPYLALNPKGRVPTLIVDGSPVTESGAVLFTLAERHPEASLVPAIGSPLRATFLERYTFIVNTHLPALRDWFYAAKENPIEDADAVRRLGIKRLKASFELIDAQLETSNYIVGDSPTIVDYLFIATTSWDGFLDSFAARYPNVKRLVEKMRATDSWKEVEAKEQIKYQVSYDGTSFL